jgi:hypothetical protein
MGHACTYVFVIPLYWQCETYTLDTTQCVLCRAIYCLQYPRAIGIDGVIHWWISCIDYFPIFEKSVSTWQICVTYYVHWALEGCVSRTCTCVCVYLCLIDTRTFHNDMLELKDVVAGFTTLFLSLSLSLSLFHLYSHACTCWICIQWHACGLLLNGWCSTVWVLFTFMIGPDCVNTIDGVHV